MVTTGDKTKLEDPEYTLGGPEQVEVILSERKANKVKAEKMHICEK